VLGILAGKPAAQALKRAAQLRNSGIASRAEEPPNLEAADKSGRRSAPERRLRYGQSRDIATRNIKDFTVYAGISGVFPLILAFWCRIVYTARDNVVMILDRSVLHAVPFVRSLGQ